MTPRSGATDDLIDTGEYQDLALDYRDTLDDVQLADAFVALVQQCDAETLHAAFGRDMEAKGYAITEPLKRQQSWEPDGDLEPEDL